MTIDLRDQIRLLFALATRLPVFWTDPRTSLGDFEGRDTTLEVFDVAEEDQLLLLRRLRPHRKAAAEKLGTKVRLLFHTPIETERLYSWVRTSDSGLCRERSFPSGDTVSPILRDADPRRSPSAPPRTTSRRAA